MDYDFEREGKQVVLQKLIGKIKGQADSLASKGSSAAMKLQALKNLSEYSVDATLILKDLEKMQNK